MASLSLIKISFALSLFFFLLPSSSSSRLSFTTLKNHHQSLTTSYPQSQTERLRSSFNLFPEYQVNIIDNEPGFTPGSLVEKKFSFLAASGSSVEDLGHHAGYYSLPHTKAARMFYFFFESRTSKDDPVVIWLTGGPGCSSAIALFYENGPFKVANNLSLVWNDYGWDKVSNIIFVDQPTGTGFSYSSDEVDIHTNETSVSNDLYDFLQAFFKEHPQFTKNEFFITGESYAGHYIPALASRVHKGNKAKEGIPINLKGFAIGNGLTNPGVQYLVYTDYAVDKGLITKEDQDNINLLIPDCERTTKSCQTNGGDSCLEAYEACTSIFDNILSVAGNINYYDVRKQCEGNLCYDFSNAVTFLNDRTVKAALGVKNLSFVSCSSTVYNAMLNDWMKNLEVDIPSLLEDGIRMLIYAGEEDLVCNWLGNSKWVHALKWSGQKGFESATTTKFVVDGVTAGDLTSHEPVSFLKIFEAGHMVPMDQPKVALQMLKSWTEGKLAA
ncbi:unnamed protein product [Lupinus luteus]|uniref:Carboxypeptidase n=1 Tax=Lupinus luteus TaxID=3873 RepID=A0AAV1YM41_LUPLU